MSVTITINNAVKRFGDKTIIPDLSLEIKEGEFFTLLGPSGCGKTTLLRMIAGFNTIEGGEFYFNDKLINDIPPHQRNIGMVFQNYAVFPHMSVEKNVGYGLKQRNIKNPEYTELVDEILNIVQISDLKDRMPTQMSGGQQQRVALARAIVIRPNVLLMDEPLSNLDAKLRVDMRLAIKRIQNQFKITAIYVTHDQEEALSMSDRIAVMNYGVIQQVGTPLEIYTNPANLFVATFIGQSNIFDVKLTLKQTIELFDGSSYTLKRLQSNLKENQTLKLIVRPTEINFTKEGVKGVITEKIFLGSEIRYQVKLENNQIVEVAQDVKEKHYFENDKVNLSFDKDVINVFDSESQLSVMVGNEND